ncbi:MAG: DUF2764 family protein [Victivallales bacterium]
MAGYYYLISSLPMLMFNEKASLSIEEFNAACIDKISENDLNILRRLNLVPEPEVIYPAGSAAERWRQWEVCLRNRIAGHRASQGRDVHNYLQEEKGCFCEIDTGVQEAFALKNPLEREKYFDRMRWRALEDFEAGHHFDFDKLCIYKLKLLLLEKWRERQVEQGTKNLDVMLEQIDRNFSDNNKN